MKTEMGHTGQKYYVTHNGMTYFHRNYRDALLDFLSMTRAFVWVTGL